MEIFSVNDLEYFDNVMFQIVFRQSGRMGFVRALQARKYKPHTLFSDEEIWQSIQNSLRSNIFTSLPPK